MLVHQAMSAKVMIVLLSVGLAACQTRTQATAVAIGAGSVGLVGGYFEHDARTDGADLPSLSPVVGGAVAIVSAISIFVLDYNHVRPRGRRRYTRPDTWEPETQRGTSELLAAIRRTPCFGLCPAYSVAIYRDGVVEYRGRGNVRTLDTVLGQLSVDRLRALEEQFARADFLTLRKRYVETDCMGLPTVYVWYRPLGGATKSVAHYLGDRSAPNALVVLEQAIDAAVGSEHWTGSEHAGPYATYCRER